MIDVRRGYNMGFAVLDDNDTHSIQETEVDLKDII